MEEFNMDPVFEQTKRETDKKCDACGGTMEFDPASGKLLCPYCGAYKDIMLRTDRAVEELDIRAAEHMGSNTWGAATKTVICKSCGAESVYDALAVANICPYCGSTQVMQEADNDSLAPSGVVPFGVPRQRAGELFTKWIKGKLFAPNAAKKSAKAETFQGVYLPYWTYDAETYSTYSAKYGKDRRVKRGDKWETVTDWYNCSGDYSRFFDDVLVAGTGTKDKGILNAIEPFDCKRAVPYSPEFLAGFCAERYAVGLKDGWSVAADKMRSMLDDAITSEIRSRHNADRVSGLRFGTNYSAITYKYVMLPVWLSSFTYKGKVFNFMVNGQTGRVGGKSPVSAIKVTIAIVVAVAVLVLLYYLFQ